MSKNNKTYEHYAVYGSLRRPIMPRYGQNVVASSEFIEEGVPVNGFLLKDNVSYPYAQRSDNNETMLVDVVKFNNPAVRDGIANMEFCAGYYLDEVEINGEAMGIFLIAKDEDLSNYPTVESGDWVKYYFDKMRS